MLFQTCLVSEFPEAVWAFQGAVVSTMGRLHVIVQEPFLGEIFATRHTDKGSFASVHPVMDIQVTLSGIGLCANGTHERFFTGMHTNVFLQAVVVVASFFAKWAHEVGRFGMGCHVCS